jgi:hypothetical protein
MRAEASAEIDRGDDIVRTMWPRRAGPAISPTLAKLKAIARRLEIEARRERDAEGVRACNIVLCAIERAALRRSSEGL